MLDSLIYGAVGAGMAGPGAAYGAARGAIGSLYGSSSGIASGFGGFGRLTAGGMASPYLFGGMSLSGIAGDPNNVFDPGYTQARAESMMGAAAAAPGAIWKGAVKTSFFMGTIPRLQRALAGQSVKNITPFGMRSLLFGTKSAFPGASSFLGKSRLGKIIGGTGRYGMAFGMGTAMAGPIGGAFLAGPLGKMMGRGKVGGWIARRLGFKNAAGIGGGANGGLGGLVGIGRGDASASIREFLGFGDVKAPKMTGSVGFGNIERYSNETSRVFREEASINIKSAGNAAQRRKGYNAFKVSGTAPMRSAGGERIIESGGTGQAAGYSSFEDTFKYTRGSKKGSVGTYKAGNFRTTWVSSTFDSNITKGVFEADDISKLTSGTDFTLRYLEDVAPISNGRLVGGKVVKDIEGRKTLKYVDFKTEANIQKIDQYKSLQKAAKDYNSVIGRGIGSVESAVSRAAFGNLSGVRGFLGRNLGFFGMPFSDMKFLGQMITGTYGKGLDTARNRALNTLINEGGEAAGKVNKLKKALGDEFSLYSKSDIIQKANGDTVITSSHGRHRIKGTTKGYEPFSKEKLAAFTTSNQSYAIRRSMMALGGIMRYKYYTGILKKEATRVGEGVVSSLKEAVSTVNNIGKMEFGTGRTLETQVASTERTRAISAMQNVGISARSYLGQEANIMAQ